MSKPSYEEWIKWTRETRLAFIANLASQLQGREHIDVPTVYMAEGDVVFSFEPRSLRLVEEALARELLTASIRNVENMDNVAIDKKVEALIRGEEI